MTATPDSDLPLGCFWDPRIGSPARTVLPGTHLVTNETNVAVTTLLGSCVAACIRDSELGLGGLNHFLLPDGPEDGSHKTARYGIHAMEVLVNDILKQGGRRERLEAKVFGGANVIDLSAHETVGDSNARFVVTHLEREGIQILSSDLGGECARRVYFFPTTGRVRVQKLAPAETRDLGRSETQFHTQINDALKVGGVELFQ
ncbi:MAG: chemoreceptor glutamine deamidase CheD [Pseudomonadota bacterium]